MKKVYLLLLLLSTTFAFSANAAQADTLKVKKQTTDTTKTKVKVGGYLSTGLSVTNSTDFLTSSYFGVEGGVTINNFGAGLVIGRGSLRSMGTKNDSIQAYFYEVKATYSRTLTGNFGGTILFGYGGYFATKKQFIEYGLGVSYAIKQVSVGLTYSNWDGGNYITPGITYNF